MRIFLLAAFFFAAVAPTLSWLEFSGGSENLVVATVLETKREGAWLIPTLKGIPRTTKPPLTTWISAAAVTDGTMSALSDPAQRETGYRALALQSRWPALAVSCLLLIATAYLGRLVGGDTVGLMSAFIAGSSILWLRFGRSATTDVQLALWVTLANCCFTAAIFIPRRRWVACATGGIALGLAIMSKGPVALVQSAVPILIFALWRRWRTPRDERQTIPWLPILSTALITLAIALPWPIYVLLQHAGQLSGWWREIFRTSDEGFGTDPPWSYLAIVPLLIPWCGLLILGIVAAIWERDEYSMLALMLLLVPILIMLCFKDKNERYLLPMLAPAAILCAQALVRQRDDRYETSKRFAVAVVWALLLAIAIGLPAAGLFLKTVDGQPWWSRTTAAIAIILFAMLLIIGFVLRRRPSSLFITATVAMLLASGLFMNGYAKSESGRSELKPLADVIVAAAPSDAEIWDYKTPNGSSRVPNDLGIYLNRTIRPVDHLDSIQSRPRPQVLLVYVPGRVAAPEPLASLPLLGHTRRNNGEWRAYSLRR